MPGHPLPHLAGTYREDVFTDELLLAVPSIWEKQNLHHLAGRPFAMEPAGTPAGQWARSTCREAGFEPDVRYTSTDLQIHVRLVEQQLAVSLLPDLAGAHGRRGVTLRRLEGRPKRTVFTRVRS